MFSKAEKFIKIKAVEGRDINLAIRNYTRPSPAFILSPNLYRDTFTKIRSRKENFKIKIRKIPPKNIEDTLFFFFSAYFISQAKYNLLSYRIFSVFWYKLSYLGQISKNH